MTLRGWTCPSCATGLVVDEVYDDLFVDCRECGGTNRFRYIGGTYHLRIHTPSRSVNPVDQDSIEDDVVGAEDVAAERHSTESGADIVPEWYRALHTSLPAEDSDTSSNARKHGQAPRLLWSNAKATPVPAHAKLPRSLPIRRGDCINEPRPCPFVSCRHHLALIVDASGVSETFPGTFDDLVFSGPLREDGRFSATLESRVIEGPHLGMLPATCVLDLVDEHGELTLLSIAYLMNVSRERIRQIEAKTLRKLRAPLELLAKDE
jgi:hypothetical protein